MEATAEVHAHPLCLKCNVRVPASEMEAHSKRCRFSPSPFDMAAAAQSRKLKTIEHARREIVTATALQSTSLDRLSYFFDSKGTLRHRKTRRTAKQEIQFQPANNVLYSDLVDAVIEAVQHRMITKMGFSKILVPAESTALHPQARAPIFCSRDWAIASNLLVVIQSSGGVRPGIWSRSLCFEHGLESGSMIPIIHRAQKLKRPMGIIVINPNENDVRVQDTTSFAVKQKKIKVAFSETPSRHLVYVWDHYIQKARAKSIFVLAHGQGGSLVQHLFEKRSSARRSITAVALTDSTHIAHGPNAEGNAAHANATMRAKAINWYLLPASSESSPAVASGTPTPRGERFSQRVRKRVGCTCIALEASRIDKHEYNTAWINHLAARSIFRFFAWASDEGRMIAGCSTFADEETRASIRDDPCAPSPPPILLEPSRVSPVEDLEDQEELLRTMVLPKSPPSPQRKRRSYSFGTSPELSGASSSSDRDSVSSAFEEAGGSSFMTPPRRRSFSRQALSSLRSAADGESRSRIERRERTERKNGMGQEEKGMRVLCRAESTRNGHVGPGARRAIHFSDCRSTMRQQARRSF